MKIVSSNTPAIEAGEHISHLIVEHSGDTLCLLSGGSALDVVEHIRGPENSELRTIFMLGDERWSRAEGTNNYLQLQQRYPNHWVTGSCVESVPEPAETLSDFATRLGMQLEQSLQMLHNTQVLYLAGVGTDGHTAGIFPATEDVFANTYGRNQSIVPVHLEGLKIDSRASATPAWIQQHVTHMVGYVVGQEKREILESLGCEVKSLHERPAELLRRFEATVYTDIPLNVCK